MPPKAKRSQRRRVPESDWPPDLRDGPELAARAHRIRIRRYSLSALAGLCWVVIVAVCISLYIRAQWLLASLPWLSLFLGAALVLSTVWVTFSIFFTRKIKQQEDPYWLRIEMGRFVFASWLTALALGTFEYQVASEGWSTLQQHCEETTRAANECSTDLTLAKYGVIACIALVMVTSVIQLVLALLIYRDPLINPSKKDLDYLEAHEKARETEALHGRSSSESESEQDQRRR